MMGDLEKYNAQRARDAEIRTRGWAELDLGVSVPEPPPKKEKGGVSWVAYRPQKPVHCDVCLAEVHAKWPDDTHAPNVASYRRKEKGVDTYWCSIHAEPKKAADNREKKR